MAFSYASAYKRFNSELAKKHALYAELGMTSEQIEALDQFDTKEFLSECVYRMHSQSFDPWEEDSDFDDGQNPMYKKFGDILSVEMKITFSGKYGWIQEIESPELLSRLLKLSEEDLVILNASVFEGKTQKLIAAEQGISQKNISKKLKRIKKFLSNGENQ